MKPQITIDENLLPKNHAIDLIAREVVKLKDRIESIHYCMADGDECGLLTKELEEVQGKLNDCQDAIKIIYSQM